MTTNSIPYLKPGRVLPATLHAAYDWTKAAGELEALLTATDSAAYTYAVESRANFLHEFTTVRDEVTVGDLLELRAWIREAQLVTHPGFDGAAWRIRRVDGGWAAVGVAATGGEDETVLAPNVYRTVAAAVQDCDVVDQEACDREDAAAPELAAHSEA